jgi:type IV secretory pathway VirB10-like protein
LKCNIFIIHLPALFLCLIQHTTLLHFREFFGQEKCITAAMAKRAQMPLGKKKMNAKDSVKRKPANSNESPVVKKVKPMSQSPPSCAPKQQNSEEACTETLSKNKENSPPLKLTRRSTSEAAIKAAVIKAAALEAAAATAATSPSPKKDKAEGEQG